MIDWNEVEKYMVRGQVIEQFCLAYENALAHHPGTKFWSLRKGMEAAVFKAKLLYENEQGYAQKERETIPAEEADLYTMVMHPNATIQLTPGQKIQLELLEHKDPPAPRIEITEEMAERIAHKVYPGLALASEFNRGFTVGKIRLAVEAVLNEGK